MPITLSDQSYHCIFSIIILLVLSSSPITLAPSSSLIALLGRTTTQQLSFSSLELIKALVARLQLTEYVVSSLLFQEGQDLRVGECRISQGIENPAERKKHNYNPVGVGIEYACLEGVLPIDVATIRSRCVLLVVGLVVPGVIGMKDGVVGEEGRVAQVGERVAVIEGAQSEVSVFYSLENCQLGILN